MPGTSSRYVGHRRGAGLTVGVSFRGRPTASMVYDRLPVIDHFAVVDTDDSGRPTTLLAVINGRGTVSDGEHFWFILDRAG